MVGGNTVNAFVGPILKFRRGLYSMEIFLVWTEYIKSKDMCGYTTVLLLSFVLYVKLRSIQTSGSVLFLKNGFCLFGKLTLIQLNITGNIGKERW
jgi:hypothetical protein